MTLTRGGRERHKFTPNVSVTRNAPLKKDEEDNDSSLPNNSSNQNSNSFNSRERGGPRGNRGGPSRGGRGEGLLNSPSAPVSGPFSQGPSSFLQNSGIKVDRSKIVEMKQDTFRRPNRATIIHSDDDLMEKGENEKLFESSIPPLESLSLSDDPFRPLLLNDLDSSKKKNIKDHPFGNSSDNNGKQNLKMENNLSSHGLLPMDSHQLCVLQIPEELIEKESFICLHESGKTSIQIGDDDDDLIDLIPAIDTLDEGISIFAIDTEYGQSFDLGSRYSHLIAEPTALQCIKYILTKDNKVEIKL